MKDISSYEAESLSECCETVVLVLKDVIFRHTESKFLSDFLIEKYGFTESQDKIKEIAKSKIVAAPIGDAVEKEVEETKYSTTKILSGDFSDSQINIYILGEVVQKEDTIEIDDKENYTVYNSKYQLVKIASKSGYAITRLIESLSVDLGLEIKAKEWLFHRNNNQ